MFAPEGIPGRSAEEPRAQIRATPLRSIVRMSVRRMAAIVAIPLFVLVIGAPTASAQVLPAPYEILPSDAQPTAAIPRSLFDSWFTNCAATLNGAVKPADSLNFGNPDRDNVPFYQWAEQMFLWLTSPDCQGIVLVSPEFYTVSALTEGKRTLTQNQSHGAPNLVVRAAKPGPEGLPVAFDKAGVLHEIVDSVIPNTDTPGVLGNPDREHKEGTYIPVGSIEVDRSSKVETVTIFDNQPNHARIVNPRPIIPPEIKSKAVLGKLRAKDALRAKDVTVYLTRFGDPVELNVGQTIRNSVLLAQTKSLVYYMITVNDGYAFFMTGVNSNKFNPKPEHFPTTYDQFKPVIDLAAAHGPPLAHSSALCVEVKTSWVEADANLPNRDSYIQIEAWIPDYNKENSKIWTATNPRKAKLALVGMHIAGSVKGHPEMLWATFEHIGNTPNAAYQYYSMTGLKTAAQQTDGNWLFCQSGAANGFNFPTQQLPCKTPLVCDKIKSTIASDIAPENAIRYKPFGAAWDQPPNANVADVAASNTQIISVNNSVRNPLAALGDIRANYFLLGATWTDGKAPGFSFGSDTEPGNIVGTSQLANSTMETFFIQGDNMAGGHVVFNRDQSCLTCHKNGEGEGTTDVTTSVSQIFGPLQPLFP